MNTCTNTVNSVAMNINAMNTELHIWYRYDSNAVNTSIMHTGIMNVCTNAMHTTAAAMKRNAKNTNEDIGKQRILMQ